jgi:hypothetical protein
MIDPVRTSRYPGYSLAIIRILSDGNWYTATQLAAALRKDFESATLKMATNALSHLKSRLPNGKELARKRIGRRCQYRLRDSATPAKLIPASVLTTLMEEAKPIIVELKQWGTHNEYEMSPSAIRVIAARLEKLFGALDQSIAR